MKLYEYIDKAIYNYASCYDAPDTSDNEEFSDALVDVIDLIRESSIGELELIEDDESEELDAPVEENLEVKEEA